VSFGQRKYVGWSTGYHTTWGGQSPANIYFKAYTHVCYFSGSINIPSTANSKTFTSACHANNTKAILSIGGWGTANAFENATNTAEKRANFIANIVNGLKNGGYDGVDIDWEEEGNGISNNYTLLVKELRAALDAITPRPLLTIATAQNQVNSAVSVKDYVDQMNLMSYWTLVGGMQSYVNSFTSRGIPKSLLGIGWGYDTDGEVDVNNPNDIGAKCLFAIDGGYGGVMIWEIARACSKCQDTNAYYVNKSITSVRPMFIANKESAHIFSVQSGNIIRYTLSSAEFVEAGLFTLKGVLVKTLIYQKQQPGTYSIFLGTDNIYGSYPPGLYLFKMATLLHTETRTVVVK